MSRHVFNVPNVSRFLVRARGCAMQWRIVVASAVVSCSVMGFQSDPVTPPRPKPKQVISMADESDLPSVSRSQKPDQDTPKTVPVKTLLDMPPQRSDQGAQGEV